MSFSISVKYSPLIILPNYRRKESQIFVNFGNDGTVSKLSIFKIKVRNGDGGLMYFRVFWKGEGNLLKRRWGKQNNLSYHTLTIISRYNPRKRMIPLQYKIIQQLRV